MRWRKAARWWRSNRPSSRTACPIPATWSTARALEHVIRNEAALPATIAVLGGRLKVGLDEAELEHVAQSPNMAKASVRDLPILIAGKQDGATTVASTMRIAAMAGIRVFATGGIGGVHRGAEVTADVSADLTELAQSPSLSSPPAPRRSSICHARWRCWRP
jgi:pseudouridine-5'-phosphate glycosidase